MKIIKQTNPYECGICSLNMIINYYNNTNTNIKDELYNKTYINEFGISLMNLELLGLEYNVHCESYFSEWKEIFDQKPKHPFILVMKVLDQLHYIVGIYKNQKITTYDPNGEIKIYDINTPPKNFNNIFISTNLLKIEKKKINIKKFNWKQPSYWYISIILILSLLLFLISTFFNFLISKILNMIDKNNTQFLIYFIFWILLYTLFQYFFKYIIFLFSQWYNKRSYFMHLYEFKNKLLWKTNEFYKITNKNEFLFFYSILKQYLQFWNEFLAKILKAIVITLLSVVFIILLDYKLIFFILVSIFLNTTISLLQVRKEYKYNKKLMNASEEITKLLTNISMFNTYNFQMEINTIKYDNLIIKLRTFEKLNNRFNEYNFNYNALLNNINNLINLFIFSYIILMSSKNIGNITIYFSLISMLTSNFSEFINTLLDTKNFKLVTNILNNILNINNLIINDNKLKCNGINTIEFEDKNILKNNTIVCNNFNLSTFLAEEKIKINNIPVNEYDMSIYEHIKYISNIDISIYDNSLYSLNDYVNDDLKHIYYNFLNTYNFIFIDKNPICKFALYLFLISKYNKKLIFFETYLNIDIYEPLSDLIKLLLNQIRQNNIIIYVNNNLIE